MKLGFIYAGQGQQFLEMGSDVARECAWAKEIFNQAQAILGYDLLNLINTDQEKLNQTKYTQPALFVVDYILGEYLRRNKVEPDYVAGLSLGEYNALVCADILSFEDALNIIKVRAQLMNDAYPVNETKMAAVLKADIDLVNKVLSNVYDVAICNYNTYDQVVIGGYTDQLKKAIELLKEAGQKRVIELDVSCCSHMHLLNDASLKLEEELSKYSFNKPSVNFINNIEGKIQENNFIYSLANHISKPTHLQEIIDLMLGEEVDVFIEVGPKKTIGNFIKSIAKKNDKEVKILNVYDLETLKETIKELSDINE